MKILLVGHRGQVGTAIKECFDHDEIITPSRSELDITQSDQVKLWLQSHQPDVVINTAAYHNLHNCESHPLKAFSINCIATRNIAKTSHDLNCLFVSFSTDYVFDGFKDSPYDESDYTNPIQIYGMSRLAGELAIMSATSGNALIIRTCGVYGDSHHGRNFVTSRLKDASEVDSISIGMDQTVTPTYSIDIAVALKQMLEKNAEPGIYHMTNEGQCNWFEFTHEIYLQSKNSIDLKPIDRKGLDGAMHRPINSVLKNTKLNKLGITLPHWRDALSQYLTKLQ